MEELKYFNKRRVSNILAAIIIVWCLALWTYVFIDELDGTPVILSDTNGTLLLTVVGILSSMSGFALKHLFDACGE